MRNDPDQVLEALRAVAWPILQEGARVDCCIAATRIGIRVLGCFGVHGVPFEVVALAGNASYLRWVAGPPESPPPADARYVLTDPDSVREGGYAGHLVIVGRVRGSEFLLDLAAPQFHRPEKAILVPEPLLVRGGERYGRRVVELPEQGLMVVDPHPRGDRRYLESPDWTLRGFRRARASDLAGRLVEAVADRLERRGEASGSQGAEA